MSALSEDVLSLRTMEQILADMERDEYVPDRIDGVLDISASTILGDPFIGKTWLALDATRSLLSGEDFLGRKVLRPAERVAYLFTDPGASEKLAGRIESTGGIDPRRVSGQSFYAPDSLADWKRGALELRREGYDVVFLDNTTDLARDASGPAAVKVITDGLRLWTDDGITLVNIHHLNKGGPYGQSEFGSIIWRKWTRAKLTLRGSPKSARRTLEVLPNDGAPVDFKLAFDPVGSPAFKVTSATDTTEQERQQDAVRVARNIEMARWIVEHCQGVSNLSEVARQVEAAFGQRDGGKRMDSYRKNLGRGDYPVDHDGEGNWRMPA